MRARAAASEPPSNAEVRQLIAAGVPRLVALASDESVSDEELCERSLALRGKPLAEAPLRRLARERARAWEFLSGEPWVPATAEEFLTFYELANRLEPHYCTTIPARFRTADDPLPFSHGRHFFDRVDVDSKHETSPTAEIPDAVDELLRLVGRDDLLAEYRAFAGYAILLRIHPFRDGNGHAARMLALGLLAPHYDCGCLLALVERMQAHRPELSRYLEGMPSNAVESRDLVDYGLDLMSEALDSRGG